MNKQAELERIRKLATEICTIADKLFNCDKTPVAKLNLSNRALKCLHRGNIKYVEQLIKLTDKDLLRFRNMGTKTLAEIKEKVKVLGFDYW